MFVLVQSVNVYPQLLLGRLLFSLGASCTSTMVTAILPSMVSKASSDTGDQPLPDSASQTQTQKSRHSRLAGFVGLFTGVGALLAVGVYLPLPSRLQHFGVPSEKALADTYYLAGATGIVVASACYLGLDPEIDTAATRSESFQRPDHSQDGFQNLWHTYLKP